MKVNKFSAKKWHPTSYKIPPNNLKNGAQFCFTNFDSRLFRSTFFVKEVSILLLSFTLSHFHMSGLWFLQKIFLLVFHMPQKWPEMNMALDLDLDLATF